MFRKIFILIIICLTAVSAVRAQKDTTACDDVEPRRSGWSSVSALYHNMWDDRPSYKAPSILGMDNDSLCSYIAHAFQYPFDELGDNLDYVQCEVTFDVDSTGCVSSVRSVQLYGDYPSLAYEAARVVKGIRFSGCPLTYNSRKKVWLPDTTGLQISFKILPYPVEKVDAKEAVLENLCELKSYQMYASNGWGSKPGGWVLQQKLKAMTSTAEKVEMVKNHPDPVVRRTAFKGLVEEHYPGCAMLLANALSDGERIMTWACDVGGEDVMADALIDDLFYEPGACSESDSLMIDSLVFYSPSVAAMDYRARLLHKMAPTPERYARIKEMCQDPLGGSALPLLAQFRKEEDKAIVIEALGEFKMGLDDRYAYNGEPKGRTNEALQAIALWPDADFVPALERLADFELKRKLFDYSRIKRFYAAVMEYDNDWAFNFLQDYLGRRAAQKIYSHPENLFRAYYLNPHPHKRFRSLVKKYGKEPFDWEWEKEWEKE